MKRHMNRLGMGMILAAAAALPAKTLTVAKSGGQYATVQAGLDAAAAGDTVLVKAGVYGEGVSFGKSGSAAGGYITLLGEAGAILDGTGLGGEELVSIDSKSYVQVIGFEVRNLKGGGTPIGISVTGGGSFIGIRRNKVHHIENANGNAHGVAVYGTSSTPISDLSVDGNEIHSCKLGQSESMVLNGNVTRFKVTGNVVHDNDNIGIDFIGFEGTGPAGMDQANNGVCIGNRVYNISSGSNPTYGGERSADGIYVDGGRDILIERNVVDNCDIAFEIASEHGGKTTGNITLRNNFASRSFQGNIMAGGYAANKGNAANIVIVNNTTYLGADGELILQNNCNGVVIKNNIFHAGSGNKYLASSGSNNTKVSADNNLYFGASTTSPGSWTDAHALYANPKLANAPSDLHLLSGSPAIDAGAALDTAMAGNLDIDGQARVGGSGMDIGADEIGGPSSLGGGKSSRRFARRGGAGQDEKRTRDGLGRVFPGALRLMPAFSNP